MAKKLTFRIWILIILVLFSLILIFGLPPKVLEKGILITGVESNSTAFHEGLRQGQIITSIDGVNIENVNDFYDILKDKFPSEENVKTIIKIKNSKNPEIILFSNNSPEITVSNIPKTNLKTGLDLSGGARALVKAKDKELSSSEVRDLVDITRNRLNVYGISDVNVHAVSDLSGSNYMLIEIAGATQTDLKKLIEEQGKFEAKIGNETVFIGGNRDISFVCKNDAKCAGITSCESSGNQNFCNFMFTITLSAEAAQRHADITKKLTINDSNPQYLSKPLELYVDDNLVDTLLISKGLQGRVETEISISGSGQGVSRTDAEVNARKNMHNLQTILITGSLPYKLEIVKLDTISPILGDSFINTILLAFLVAILSVIIIIFVRYRNIKASFFILSTSFSEIIIILGIASLIGWNLDLLSIAGILATVGTGIDQQIIILDESRQRVVVNIKEKLKRALSIIVGAYFTAFVSLIPLLWAGAGLLKGFAITTIIGITAGVLITRPAFTDLIRITEKEGNHMPNFS